MSDRRTTFVELAGAVRELARDRGATAPSPRPPGAVPEADFRLLCTGCGDCVPACPHGAIGLFPPGSGPLAGTPAMDPNQAPCHLCEGLPCAAACPEGALIPLAPRDIFLGLASIREDRCFVFQGPECGACAPACPPRALRMVAGRPLIDDEACVGCGLCRAACPVWDKAILVEW